MTVRFEVKYLIWLIIILLCSLCILSQSQAQTWSQAEYLRRNPHIARTSFSFEDCSRAGFNDTFNGENVTYDWWIGRRNGDPVQIERFKPYGILSDIQYAGDIPYVILYPRWIYDVDTVLLFAGWYYGEDFNPHPSCQGYGVWLVDKTHPLVTQQ